MTQSQVADKAGVRQGTIGNIESGTRQRPRELLAIADAVQVPARWLESGRGSPPATVRQPNTPTADPTFDLAAALPVVLGRLPGLDTYTADKVLGALRAAISATATLEQIEHDLLQWLDAPRAALRGTADQTPARRPVMARVYSFPSRPARPSPIGVTTPHLGVESIRGDWGLW